MKKILTGITAVLLILALCTACSGGKSVDLNTLMDTVNSDYALTGMKVIEDTDSLNRYYQIEADDVRQFAAELTKSASDYTEIILIEATDATAAEAVKTQLGEHLRSQLSNAKSYDAEQVAMIEACEVKQNGNFIYLVIGEKHGEIEADIEKALQ